jgi:hypothetical protein
MFLGNMKSCAIWIHSGRHLLRTALRLLVAQTVRLQHEDFISGSKWNWIWPHSSLYNCSRRASKAMVESIDPLYQPGGQYFSLRWQ